MTIDGTRVADTHDRGTMTAFPDHLGRYRKQTANRLPGHELLLMLRSAGNVIQPYIFREEGRSVPSGGRSIGVHCSGTSRR